jgi:cephalosporin-C deacetylase
MPILDKPLPELREYTGINPRPEDFDGYWERGLKEMRETDPAVQVTPAEFQAPFAECCDMFFTGVGGSRVYAKLLRPRESGEPGPALLKFHGYTGASGDWVALLPYAAAGFTVAAMDCRGQGGRSEDRGLVGGNTHKGHIIRGLADGPEKLYYRAVFLDTAMLAGIVAGMPGVDPSRMGAAGSSQGGALTLACAALVPELRRAAAGCPFLSDYRRVWDMDLGGRAYEELGEFFKKFDPLHEREEEIFTTLGYIDVQHLAPRIKADVRVYTALRDDICPPSTQFAAYNRLTSAKEMRLYPDFGHGVYPGQPDDVFEFMTGM